MSGGVIDEDDEVARCIIFPKAFQGSVHTDEALIVFSGTGDDGASHESGVLCRLAPNDQDIHRIGCNIASIQNERLKAEPESAKRRFYCGFRRALAKDVAIQGDKYRVTLTLDGEGGEASHVDIALHVDSENRNERATIKIEAGLALAEAFGTAVTHICNADCDNDRHPLRIDPECLIRGVPRLGSLQASLNLDSN